MKKEKLTAEDLSSALTQVNNHIASKVTVVPFFGTLLGLTRDDRPIEGDDDLDFFVDQAEFGNLLSVLWVSETFEILFESKSTNFVLACTMGRVKVPIAFHGYQRINGYLLDRWNWSGIPEIEALALRVPETLMFPLKVSSASNLVMPAQQQALCRFLYGKSWQVPKVKFIDYKTVALFGRPMRLYGLLARLSHSTVFAIKRLVRYRQKIKGPHSWQL